MQPQRKTLRPDSKGRISLGKLSEGVTGFRLIVESEYRIVLEPLVEIPAQEKWLFENKVALRQVEKGLKDAASGKLTKQDFSQYLDDDIE